MMLTAMKCSWLMAHGAGLLSHVPVSYYIQPGRFLGLTLSRKKEGWDAGEKIQVTDLMFRKEILASTSRSVENAEHEHGSLPNLR